MKDAGKSLSLCTTDAVAATAAFLIDATGAVNVYRSIQGCIV